MIAVGCLIPVLLVLCGTVAGATVGTHAAVIGAVGGGAIGLAILVALAWGWDRIRSRGP